jgi:hypothetical protein
MPPVLQHEGAHLLLVDPQRRHRGRAGADKVADRLMPLVRHPDLRQLAGPQQLRQRHGIAAVGLDAVARLPRDQGRSDDGAGMAELDDEAVQPVTGRPGLVAEGQLPELARQLGHHLAHALGRGVDLAQVPDLAVAPGLGDRDRVPLLGDIDPDESLAALDHGWSSLR